MHSSVSSQSKMVTVCELFGRLSCGMNARECSSFLIYPRRMSSLERLADAWRTATTSTGCSSPVCSEGGTKDGKPRPTSGGASLAPVRPSFMPSFS